MLVLRVDTLEFHRPKKLVISVPWKKWRSFLPARLGGGSNTIILDPQIYSSSFKTGKYYV